MFNYLFSIIEYIPGIISQASDKQMKYFLPVLILLCHISYGQVRDTTYSLQSLINDSTTTKINNSSLLDSTKKNISVDTLKPLHQQALSEKSFFLTNKEIIKLDYRYAGDLFKPFGPYFTKDFGFIGQPNEIMLYGTGFNGISYLEDGILFNNRLTNSLDLNQIQSENIDSIEIVPLPRGFLYSPYNNSVSVNFISKDFLSSRPYSRIKYYQGPNGEAMVDGLFNMWLYKKLNAYFDITNRKTDSSYANTSLSLWQSRLKLKYLLNNKINITGSFYYATSKTGLNGGADIIKIDSTASNPNNILYDERLAPVVYPDRSRQTKQQYFSLKLLGKLFRNSRTDLTFYYGSDYDGVSGSRDSVYFAYTDRNKTYGFSLRHDLSEKLFNFSLIVNYEKYNLNYDALLQNFHPVVNYNSSVYSASAIITLNLGNKLFVPSFFYKTAHNSYYSTDQNSKGLGADISVHLPDSISLYAGYSFYTNRSDKYINNFEASAQYNNDYLSANLQYFSRQDYYTNNYVIPVPVPALQPQIYYPAASEPNIKGLSTQLNFKFWKIVMENSATHYFGAGSMENIFFSVPQNTYTGGIYYKDILFNNNLNLKAGFAYYYTGKRRSKENAMTAPFVSPTGRLDFTLAGVIHDAAIVYFAWQNLFNNKYFIVPYYPMLQRSIRFGIAWELFN